jgi:hypothetical protein
VFILGVAACALLGVTVPRVVFAEQRDEPTPAAPANLVRDTTSAGGFLPLTLPASVGPARVFAAGFGGYDSASRGARFVSFAEGHVWGPFALRIGAQTTGAGQTIAPSIAGRVQFLSEPKHGLDAAFSLAYNTEGFTELEGEIEAVLAIGKNFGNWQLLANVAYGQDPEGRERDGEFRAAALCRLGTIYYVGLDGRGRVDLKVDGDAAAAHAEPSYDVDVGPVLNIALGPVALGAHAGFSSLQYSGSDPRFGVLALAGLGTAL